MASLCCKGEETCRSLSLITVEICPQAFIVRRSTKCSRASVTPHLNANSSQPG